MLLSSSFLLLFLGLILSKIPVSTVAKAMVIDAENYARSISAGDIDKDQQQTPSAVTYENADILALLSSG